MQLNNHGGIALKKERHHGQTHSFIVNHFEKGANMAAWYEANVLAIPMWNK